ncbi:hypothetical protein BT63DRAFT_43424 [Microthyrium microscopicum]|uniref:F-box domain-containing protein n=1 Tax=Microthyrium microscopicum TaxID=703497 RepID=A0A6A6U2L2_9PEZI|nr:hypothetical protein BT63DRAFT_43424 [Microthyrium microscopicum]
MSHRRTVPPAVVVSINNDEEDEESSSEEESSSDEDSLEEATGTALPNDAPPEDSSDDDTSSEDAASNGTWRSASRALEVDDFDDGYNDMESCADTDYWEENNAADEWLLKFPEGSRRLYNRLFIVESYGGAVETPCSKSSITQYLLRLPLEIRIQIYKYHFNSYLDDRPRHPQEAHTVFKDREKKVVPKIILNYGSQDLSFYLSDPLLRTSRQFRYEALPVLFGMRAFTLDYLPALPYFVDFLGPSGCQMVSYLDIWDSLNLKDMELSPGRQQKFKYQIKDFDMFPSLQHLRIVLSFRLPKLVNTNEDSEDEPELPAHPWFDPGDFFVDPVSDEWEIKEEAVPKMRREHLEDFWPEYDALQKLKVPHFTLAMTRGKQYFEFDRDYGAFPQLARSMQPISSLKEPPLFSMPVVVPDVPETLVMDEAPTNLTEATSSPSKIALVPAEISLKALVELPIPVEAPSDIVEAPSTLLETTAVAEESLTVPANTPSDSLEAPSTLIETTAVAEEPFTTIVDTSINVKTVPSTATDTKPSETLAEVPVSGLTVAVTEALNMTLQPSALSAGTGAEGDDIKPTWQDTDDQAHNVLPIYNFFRDFFVHRTRSKIRGDTPGARTSMKQICDFATFPRALGTTGSIMRDCPLCYAIHRHCGYHGVPKQLPCAMKINGVKMSEEELVVQFDNLSYGAVRRASRAVVEAFEGFSYFARIWTTLDYLQWAEPPHRELLEGLDQALDHGWTGDAINKTNVPVWAVFYREVVSAMKLNKSMQHFDNPSGQYGRGRRRRHRTAQFI